MKYTSRLGFALLHSDFPETNSFAGYSVYIIYKSGDLEIIHHEKEFAQT